MMTGGITQWRMVVLVPMAFVSVLVHVGLGYAVYRTPLGRVDPAMLWAGDQPIRIVRVPHDQIEIGGDVSGDPTISPADTDTPILTSDQLAEALLQIDPPPGLASDAPLPDPSADVTQPGDGITAPPIPPTPLPLLTPPLDQLAFIDVDPFDVADILPEIDLSSMSASLNQQTHRPDTRLFAAPHHATSLDAARQLLAMIGAGEMSNTNKTGRGGDVGGNVGGNVGKTDLGTGSDTDFIGNGLGMGLPALPIPTPPTPHLQAGPTLVATVPDDLIDFSAIATDATTQIELPINLDEDFTFSLTTFRDPTDDHVGYLRVNIAPRRSLRKLKTMPRDIVFLVDTSLSIPKIWMREIVRGLSTALNNLNPGDRFNIVFFNEKPNFFNESGVVPFDSNSIVAARRFLSGAQRGGNTDVNQAMSRLLVRDVAQERVYNMVLISDGRPTRGVMDTRELIQLITRDNDLAASIHCVGVGRRQNRSLLEFLAFRNRGTAMFVADSDQVAGVIRDMAGRLRYPLLKNVNLALAGISLDGVYPKNPPDVLQGQPFAIYGRFTRADLGHGITMRLIGLNNGKPFEFNYWGRFNQAQPGDATLMQAWASHHLHALYNRILAEGQTPVVQQQIDAIHAKYGLEMSY